MLRYICIECRSFLPWHSIHRHFPIATATRTANTVALRPIKRAKTEPTPIEALGSHVLLSLVPFLQPNDVLNLSSASPALDAAMNRSVWRYVLIKQCGVKPKMIKPRSQLRKMVVGLVEKKTCSHCGHFEVRGPFTAGNPHDGAKLCLTCIEIPMFNEIGHMEALRKYKLKHHELHTLPVRLVASAYETREPDLYTYDDVGEPRMKKMYNLQDVLDLWCFVYLKTLRISDFALTCDEAANVVSGVPQLSSLTVSLRPSDAFNVLPAL
ncbi:hypothetical protein SDRG_09708 [Saprolegnia diclina VS20]|uniref:F-box domain-containing protein n=1 Tax=Saprolegnia diclina (strain VS20) TaxID=1156394 RepID=T0QDB2_SAPDV|nr:hypothetical protein SDRG_09708 [Saprolegnia diclina VS20]EQC32736.1 hypothetical protein SDRG_09708 [Saprolegnia diclina VS20]|eukprot:XP_008613880.1 hypothetical protein SDRG_09708 [Saprolegnia diclina VS20]